jgi:predicted MFS family arabinose efflux permease
MSGEPTVDAGRRGLPLRRDGEFRRYWAARVISLLGSAVTYVALPVLVYQVTGSSLWTALVTVAEGAPYLCVGLLAGAVADRLDRRRLMVATDLASAALLVTVPAAYAAGVLTAPHVLVAAFAVQTLFVFFDAANFGALPALVGRDRIVAAQAALMGTGTVMELVVPALAGAALAVVAAAPLLAVDALSFVGSALLLRAITRPLWDPARAGRPRRLAVEVRDGLTFLWRQRVIRTTTLVGATQAFTGGLFIGQLVPWADKVLGVPPGDARLGLLFAAWGLGGLAATVLAPPLVRRAGEPRVILRFLPLSTLGLLASALAGRWLPAAISIAGWGVAYTVVVLAGITQRQKLTPDGLQSRVNTAGRMLSFGLGWPLGALAGGAAAEALGPRGALLGAVAVLLSGTTAAWLSPLRTAAREA